MDLCHVCRVAAPESPFYICEKCREYPVLNSDGDEMVYYNKSVTGGFEAKNKRTSEISEDHVCYINGVKCWADEYRFGGVMIMGYEYKNI